MPTIPKNYIKLMSWLDSKEYGNDCKTFGFSVGTAGYETYKLNQKMYSTHRTALEYKLGRPLANGMFALHSCHNRACCNPNHLREGLPKENSQDMVSAGRVADKERTKHKGETNGKARLTQEQVMQLRKERNEDGIMLKFLSAKYGITMSQVSAIARGLNW